MLIGVMADSHDHLEMLDRAIGVFNSRDVQALVHAGDLIAPFAAQRLLRYQGPIYVTYGNNDGEREGLRRILPQIKDGPLRLQMAGKKLLVHHYVEWCNTEDIAWADIILSGHTHEVVSESRNNKYYPNPGECCGWVNRRSTVAILNTELMSAEIIDL